jgi:hypothetical protein
MGLSELGDQERLSVGRGGDAHETEPERYKDTDDMSSDTAAGQTTQPIDLPKPTDSSYGHADILQTLPIDSSPSCLEWSNDGQAFAVTKANIYLLVRLTHFHKRKIAANLEGDFSFVGFPDTHTRILGFAGRPSYAYTSPTHREWLSFARPPIHTFKI